MGKLVSQKRLTAASDDARCCYHDIFDDPTDGDRSAFYLRPTTAIFYVVADVHMKKEASGKPGPGKPGLPGAHAGQPSTCRITDPPGAVEH